MGVSRLITLVYPEALLLGVALAYLYFRRLKTRNFWRLAMLVCAILLLGYPALIHTSKSMDLFLVVDRSRSISEEGRSKQMEILELVSRNLKPGDRLGIISFNEKAYVEQAPDSALAIKSFQIPYSEDASDLSEGLQTALNIAGENRIGRILILSDGEYTGAGPLHEAQIARQRNIPIFYRNLRRLPQFNLSIREIDLPNKILSNEPFRLSFNIASLAEVPGRYRLYRNGHLISAKDAEGWREYQFKPGENIISFYDSLKDVGIHSYRIEVEAIPREKENIFMDNVAERYVSVVGERPILVVNNTGAKDNVAQILSAGGLPCHIVDIGNFRLGLNQLEGYKGIILSNVPILNLSRDQIKALHDFVVTEGGGLLVCGGERSFAKGGYYKTSLEPILPVSLEDRNQSKKISTAFSIVLDRSGSMQMTTPSGETKISLANNAAVESLNLLTPMDTLSVIAVDSLAHIIVPQQEVSDPAGISSQILKIESLGGGIFVYTGLAAAGNELVKAKQLNKHILLFADAADSEEPGEYKKLLSDYTDAGITVSVVGLGSEKDQDAEFLKDVAARGNGQIYFTDDAGQLIQFFTADTISYVRQNFVKDPAPMKIKASAYTMSPDQSWKDFACSHYNLMFSKPDADVAIAPADEDHAPILAFWQRGLGRVATLALDPEGPFSSAVNYGDILLSSSRWIMGASVFDNLQIKTDYEGSYARIRMEVAGEEREKMGQAKLVIFDPDGAAISKPLLWDSYNQLSATVKLNRKGCYRGVVEIGDSSYKIGPMSIPVSPEFIYDRQPDFGKRSLAQMASLTAGKEIMDVAELFKRTARAAVLSPVVTPFLILFLLLLLVDIAEERFGLLLLIKQFLASRKQQLKQLNISRIKDLVLSGRMKPAGKFETPGEKTGEEPEPVVSTSKAKDETKDMGYLTKSKKEARRRFGMK